MLTLGYALMPFYVILCVIELPLHRSRGRCMATASTLTLKSTWPISTSPSGLQRLPLAASPFLLPPDQAPFAFLSQARELRRHPGNRRSVELVHVSQ